jgi:hypothetical protein
MPAVPKEKRDDRLEKLLRAEIAELKGLRKDMRHIMRRLDAINESLEPIGQKAKEDLEESELEEAIFRDVDPEAYEGLRELTSQVRKDYKAYVRGTLKK